MKVLISRPDKIGDVVLALHAAKQLKHLLPEVQVYMHVSDYTRALVENVSFIDGCVLFDTDLVPYKFDAVVDLMAKFSTAKLYFKSGIPIRIGNSARWFRFFYTRTRYIRRSQARINEAEYNWRLISLLHESLRNIPLRESLLESDFKEISCFNELQNYVALMPGVSVSAMAWPESEWKTLAQKLAATQNTNVLFIGGPAERSLLTKFKDELSHFPNVHFRIFEQFKEVLGALKSASAYVGPSTGITHLASALGVKGIGLYPHVQSMHPKRWMPFRSSLEILNLDRLPNAAEVFEVLQGFRSDKSSTPPRAPVSAFIICFNEEQNIRRSLESIKWCDEIVIVDSGSTDRTLDICREYTKKIFVRPWPGHRAQKQFALEQCSNEWVLNLDSDEELSSELKNEITSVLSQPASKRDRIKGYLLCRVVYFLDKWWDKGGWYPEYRMRFFQRRFTKWGGIDPHEKAIVSGTIRKLHGNLNHYTYFSIRHQVETLNRYAANMARLMVAAGKRPSLLNIIFNPLFRFFKFYILKLGFREGLPGFIVACSEAFGCFLKYVNIWEIHRERAQIKVREYQLPSELSTQQNASRHPSS